VVRLSTNATSYSDANSASLLDSNLTITSPQTTFANSILTLDMRAGAQAGDLLRIAPQGNAQGQVNFDPATRIVTFGGQAVGTLAPSDAFQVVFNSFATLEAINAVARRIEFVTSTLTTTPRYVGYSFSDQDNFKSPLAMKMVIQGQRTEAVLPSVVTLSRSNATIAEAAGTSFVTATLSSVFSLPVTINLGFTGTATLANDYTRTGTQIVIPAGQTTGSVTVTAVQDSLDEVNETITVDILSVSNATEATPQQAIVAIIDDDAAPTVTLSRSPATISEASRAATFTATLSTVTSVPVTVNLGFTGTATFASDYTRTGTQIVIPAGQTTGSVSVTAVQDSLDEVNETIIVDILSVSKATEATPQQATVTIFDDDAAPTVTLSRSPATISEALRTATFTATLSTITSVPVTINLGFTGTATLASDYTRTGTQIVIPAGQTTGRVTVTAVQDSLDEINETIIVDILSVSKATEATPQQATVTIIDDDAAPTVTLSRNNATIAEAAGSSIFTATLSAVTSVPVTINLGFTGTATLNRDYAHTGTQIVIPAGQTIGRVTVTALQDTLDEVNETIVVDILSVSKATEATPQQATVTVIDDDPAPRGLRANNVDRPLAPMVVAAPLTSQLPMEGVEQPKLTTAVMATPSPRRFQPAFEPLPIAPNSKATDAFFTGYDEELRDHDEELRLLSSD
jgi:hypothetical protein